MSIAFGSARFDEWKDLINKQIDYSIKHVNIFNLINDSGIKQENNADVLIVLSYQDSDLLSRNNNFNNLATRFKYILFTNYETVKLLDDHNLFYNFMKHNHLADLLPDVYDINNSQFPCVLKQSVDGCGGTNTFIIDNKENLIKKMNPEYKWIIKELILDFTEYTTHILAINGKILHTITYGTVYDYDNYIKRGAR